MRFLKWNDEELIRKWFKKYFQLQNRNFAIWGGRVVFQSRTKTDKKTYLLRVIVDTNTNPAEVITAYLTSKLQKYWRQNV